MNATGETIITRLRNSCQQNSDRLALAFRPGFRFHRWTYANLWTDVCRLATVLKDRGLQPGDRVLIWAPNCPQWVIAYFATLKAGGIVVPMDMRVSDQFVSDVVSKTRPVLAFISRATPSLEGVPEHSRVCFEDISELTSGVTEDPGELDLSVDLAEIMFTSGTTGNPKGVMLSHRNLIASIDAANHHMRAERDFRLVSVLPLSHVFEQAGGMLMPLWCGASITYATTRQPRTLFRLIHDSRATTILLVPQALELFMNGIEQEVDRQGKRRAWIFLNSVSKRMPFSSRRYLFRSVHKKFGGSLGYIVCGGAQINPAVAEKWERIGVRVVQGYGATEAAPTIASSSYDDRRFDSLGKPLPGVEVRIADGGEIQVRGANITSGYWEDPEATSTAFDDGWLKTGDIGHVDEHGYLHMSGRKRHMIVLPNGMNVFPEDVEARLMETGLVSEAAVVGIPNSRGVQVHAIVPAGDLENLASAIRQANSRLGSHQRITASSVWPGEELPKTHTLKVKKHEIIEWLTGDPSSPDEDDDDDDPGPEGPGGSFGEQGSTVARLTAGIARVSVDRVELGSTLGSDLGIDSLGRVELLAAIEERMGVVLSEDALSDDSTVEELLQLVQQGASGNPDPDISFPTWGRSWWGRSLRAVLQTAIVSTVVRACYRRQVLGKDNLRQLETKAIFAANHSLHLDNGIILRSFPYSVRRRLAVAAAAENWNNRWLAIAYPALGNAFPIARHGPVLSSLENLANVLDDDWSVLIYPEGDLYVRKGMQPFKSGVGLIASEAGLPVVPVKLEIHDYGWPSVAPFFKRGRVTVKFGEPMRFERSSDYQAIAGEIENAVRAL